MENELKHLTDTMMKVLDRYEKHLAKGTPSEALEPHKSIIAGLLEKIKTHTVKPTLQPTALRIGSQVPDRQLKPQIIHGASDDPGVKETIIPSSEIRPKANVDQVTPDNIDALSESLIENDSPNEPTVTSMKDAK